MVNSSLCIYVSTHKDLTLLLYRNSVTDTRGTQSRDDRVIFLFIFIIIVIFIFHSHAWLYFPGLLVSHMTNGSWLSGNEDNVFFMFYFLARHNIIFTCVLFVWQKFKSKVPFWPFYCARLFHQHDRRVVTSVFNRTH